MPSETTGATGLAGRYAAALYALAEADKKLDKVADDLRQLNTMISESDDLARLISSPVLSRIQQADGVLAVCKKAGMDDLTQRFVGTTAQNRRMAVLPSIIKAYLDELSHRRGEATAQVVSAQKLDEAQLKEVSDVLKKAIGTKVAVEAKVDETLLGGMIVKVGSRMVDSSLKTKLQQLHLSMKGVG
ncbi:MAG: F0F1 ATP synthase subunit delta [Rhodospirillaceae bacterium]|nr:F0F1 ATP synthase subunit delta [Rhodospirillaceae bacterium]